MGIGLLWLSQEHMLSAFIWCLFFSWLIVVCDFILCLPYRIRFKLSLLKRNGIDQPQECPYLVFAQYSGEDGGPPWWTVPIPQRFFCKAAKLGQAGTTHDQLAQRRTDHEQLAQSSPKVVPGFCPYSTCSRSPLKMKKVNSYACLLRTKTFQHP